MKNFLIKILTLRKEGSSIKPLRQREFLHDTDLLSFLKACSIVICRVCLWDSVPTSSFLSLLFSCKRFSFLYMFLQPPHVIPFSFHKHANTILLFKENTENRKETRHIARKRAQRKTVILYTLILGLSTGILVVVVTGLAVFTQ